MGEKINVKDIVKRKKEELKQKVESLKKRGIQPKLAVILASEDEASKIYVGKKRKMCDELGIEQVEYTISPPDFNIFIAFFSKANCEEINFLINFVVNISESFGLFVLIVPLPLHGASRRILSKEKKLSI